MAKGRHQDGSLILKPETAEPTRFMYSGDPVTRAGYLDANGGERYAYLASGPFTLAPGDSQEIIAVKMVGIGSNPLESVINLRAKAADIQVLYERNFVAHSDRPKPGNIPSEYRFSDPYPNPFWGFTRVELELPMKTFVDLAVYNILGQQARTLAHQDLAAGKYHFLWDGRDQTGQAMAAGIYWLRLQAAGFLKTTRVVRMQ